MWESENGERKRKPKTVFLWVEGCGYPYDSVDKEYDKDSRRGSQ